MLVTPKRIIAENSSLQIMLIGCGCLINTHKSGCNFYVWQ